MAQKPSVLLVSPMNPGSFGEFCARAIRALGHPLETFDYRRPVPPTFANRVMKRLKRESLMDVSNRELLAAARRVRPDVVLVAKGELVRPETLEEIRRALRPYMVSWHVDNPHNVLCSTPELIQSQPVFDAVYVFDPYYIPELQGIGVKNARYLPLCFDETVLRENPSTPADEAEFRANFCFVGKPSGNRYSERQDLLLAMADIGLKIWGKGWERFPQFQKNVAGTAYGPRLAKAYAHARMGFNINRDQSIEGLNMRSFESPGYGAMTLTNFTRMLAVHFKIGEEVVVYENAEDLRKKAEYYLQHEDERAAIAANGKKRCEREHTYVHRIQEIMDAVR